MLQQVRSDEGMSGQAWTALENLEDVWLTRAKRLHAIASTGLHYARDDYDRERYSELAGMACSMLADLGQVPIARIENLFSDHAQGYVTPKVDVRGAIIENDCILLVRERCDDLWTLPGGFAEVGLSPAANVIKEMREEVGLEVSVTSLYSVRHKAKGPYEPDARDFYKLFFLCERAGNGQVSAGSEISEAEFFRADNLPELSLSRTHSSDIFAAFDAKRGVAAHVLFD